MKMSPSRKNRRQRTAASREGPPRRRRGTDFDSVISGVTRKDSLWHFPDQLMRESRRSPGTTYPAPPEGAKGPWQGGWRARLMTELNPPIRLSVSEWLHA